MSEKVKVKRGTVVETEFGIGPVVAITKDWLIHEDEDGAEICVPIKDSVISVPADTSTPDIPDNIIELDS